MTLSEFKAWFEGFTETMDGPPSLKQWERIQARVKEIAGNPVTERVFIDRYRDYFFPRYAYGVGGIQNPSPLWNQTVMCSSASSLAQNSDAAIKPRAEYENAKRFDSHAAMTSLGRTEAQSFAA